MRKSNRNAVERYESYKKNIMRKGRKVEIVDEETGLVETKFKWFSKKALSNMKAYVTAFECVRDNKGLGGRSLKDSLEFSRKAIKQNGWETTYGNIRKVSQKMFYLVSIYDELYGGASIPDSVFDDIEDNFVPMNQRYGNIIPMENNYLNEPVVRKHFKSGKLY